MIKIFYIASKKQKQKKEERNLMSSKSASSMSSSRMMGLVAVVVVVAIILIVLYYFVLCKKTRRCCNVCRKTPCCCVSKCTTGACPTGSPKWTCLIPALDAYDACVEAAKCDDDCDTCRPALLAAAAACGFKVCGDVREALCDYAQCVRDNSCDTCECRDTLREALCPVDSSSSSSDSDC
jgi:hypothetical protein